MCINYICHDDFTLMYIYLQYSFLLRAKKGISYLFTQLNNLIFFGTLLKSNRHKHCKKKMHYTTVCSIHSYDAGLWQRGTSAQHLGSDCIFHSSIRGGRSRWKWPIPPTLTDPSSVLRSKSSPPPTSAPCPGLASPVFNSPIRATWEACDGHARYHGCSNLPLFSSKRRICKVTVSTSFVSSWLLLLTTFWCYETCCQVHLRKHFIINQCLGTNAPGVYVC